MDRPPKRIQKPRALHPCPQCGKSFTKRSNMLIHSRLHTGETPYVCKYAGCGRSYKWLSSINFHEGRCEKRSAGLAVPAPRPPPPPAAAEAARVAAARAAAAAVNVNVNVNPHHHITDPTQYSLLPTSHHPDLNPAQSQQQQVSPLHPPLQLPSYQSLQISAQRQRPPVSATTPVSNPPPPLLHPPANNASPQQQQLQAAQAHAHAQVHAQVQAQVAHAHAQAQAQAQAQVHAVHAQAQAAHAAQMMQSAQAHQIVKPEAQFVAHTLPHHSVVAPHQPPDQIVNGQAPHQDLRSYDAQQINYDVQSTQLTTLSPAPPATSNSTTTPPTSTPIATSIGLPPVSQGPLIVTPPPMGSPTSSAPLSSATVPSEAPPPPQDSAPQQHHPAAPSGDTAAEQQQQQDTNMKSKQQQGQQDLDALHQEQVPQQQHSQPTQEDVVHRQQSGIGDQDQTQAQSAEQRQAYYQTQVMQMSNGMPPSTASMPVSPNALATSNSYHHHHSSSNGTGNGTTTPTSTAAASSAANTEASATTAPATATDSGAAHTATANYSTAPTTIASAVVTPGHPGTHPYGDGSFRSPSATPNVGPGRPEDGVGQNLYMPLSPMTPSNGGGDGAGATMVAYATGVATGLGAAALMAKGVGGHDGGGATTLDRTHAHAPYGQKLEMVMVEDNGAADEKKRVCTATSSSNATTTTCSSNTSVQSGECGESRDEAEKGEEEVKNGVVQ